MLRRSLLSLLVSLLILSCSDASGPGRGVAGTWRLETINGQALPFALPDEPVDKLEVTAEVITLVPPRSLSIVTTFRVTDGGNVFSETIPDGGTYVVDGSTVRLTWDSDGTTTPATVTGNTMTLDDIGLRFVYRRD